MDHRYEQVPAFYFTNPAAVLGPADDVAVFPGSQQFDYEHTAPEEDSRVDDSSGQRPAG